jgi:hypothetical protein
MNKALSDDEQRLFFSLLQRVCEYHVDNFLQMSIDTGPYRFFVDISLHPQAGDPGLYEPVNLDTRLSNQRVGPPTA